MFIITDIDLVQLVVKAIILLENAGLQVVELLPLLVMELQPIKLC